MKFWELHSICSQHPRFIVDAFQQADDPRYLEWFHQFDEICDTQQRDKLDAILPPALCEDALRNYPEHMYDSGDTIRSRRFDDTDTPLSYLEVFKAYGGAFLEEVLEKGSKAKPKL